jgi:hypothetical protein
MKFKKHKNRKMVAAVPPLSTSETREETREASEG